MSFDRELGLALQRQAMRDWIAMVGGASAGAFVDEADGVTAAVVPAVPERSIANSVTYESAEGIATALDRLAGVYEAAGVNAWTVWAPDLDSEAIEALDAAGHSFDGEPLAMALELERLRAPELGDLDHDAEGEIPALGELNQAAYGLGPESGFAAIFSHRPREPEPRIYQARVDGELACMLATLDHPQVSGAAGPDCGIYFVATAESARGRGLATRLLGAALAEARERGCATSTLQASAMGEPIYRALGYEPIFRFNMYERRRPS